MSIDLPAAMVSIEPTHSDELEAKKPPRPSRGCGVGVSIEPTHSDELEV